MKKPEEILKNLLTIPWNLELTFKEGLEGLRPYSKDLEVIHFVVEPLDPSCWRKKKYFHIQKLELCSRIDDWIYDQIIRNKEENLKYGEYLDRYLPLVQAGKIKNIDEYIMNKHYRPQAIKVLSRQKSFNKLNWSQTRSRLQYKRRTNLLTKDGRELPLYEMIFIRHSNGNKEIIGVGDASGSGLRQLGTFYTAIFYLLSKEHKISRHILRYNKFNEYEYVRRCYQTILPVSFGSNFELDQFLKDEIRKKCKSLKDKKWN